MSEKTQTIFEKLVQYVKENNLKITVDLVGSWLWVYGSDTKTHKDFIKSLGFTWNRNKEKWIFHDTPFRKVSKHNFNYEEIKEMNGYVGLVK